MAAESPFHNVARRPISLLLVVCALCLLSRVGPWGGFIHRLEVDFSTVFSPFRSIQNDDFWDRVLIIYLDEESHRVLDQPSDIPWNRDCHAKLINKLKSAGCDLVYFDIVFQGKSSNPAADTNLEAAIRENGHVVLVAQLNFNSSGTGDQTVIQLYQPYREACATWGLASFLQDPDGAIRRFPNSYNEFLPGPLAAARFLLKDDLPPISNSAQSPLLVFHPSFPSKLDNQWSYYQVLDDSFPLEKLKNKWVFIGAKQSAGFTGSGKDTFLSPFSRINGRRWNGVDFHVVAFHNYLYGHAVLPASIWEEAFWLSGISLLLWGNLAFNSIPWRIGFIGVIFLLCVGGGFFYAESIHHTYPFISLLFISLPASLFLALFHTSKIYDVFISYRRADERELKFLNPLLVTFKKAGLKIWVDQKDIKWNEDYQRAISKAISNSRSVLLVATKLAMESPEIMVEYRLARSEEIQPFVLVLCNITGTWLQLALGSLNFREIPESSNQAIDFTPFVNEIRKSIRPPFLRRWIRKIMAQWIQ